ncbi:Ras-related protein Rab-3A [Varanus komodoensis]|nr:Ras-related protein Rab-3A [Varanus komodoensis]
MASVTDTRFGHKDASDQNFDYMFKLLIIGNSSVGKTSFLFRYADNTFTPAFVSTVGIDFKVKTVYRNDKRVKLQIWVAREEIRFYLQELYSNEILNTCHREVSLGKLHTVGKEGQIPVMCYEDVSIEVLLRLALATEKSELCFWQELELPRIRAALNVLANEGPVILQSQNNVKEY